MKMRESSYQNRIKWRIRGLWLAVIAMLVYMVVIGEMGGGDSRIMDDTAERVSRIVFFGGLIFLIVRIVKNKKLLKSRFLRREQLLKEQDERANYLHDKSGGIAMDILLVCLLAVTLTASLFNMTAFYTAAGILTLAIATKAGLYLIYSRAMP